MANAFDATAAGLPFAVFRGFKGAGLPDVNDKIKSVTCPYTGETLATVPALDLDCAIVHANKANKRGDVLIEGIIGVQKEAMLGARKSLVTVEEIVDDFDDESPNACILPHWTITAITCVPGGAHPSYAHGYYRRDNAFYKAWDGISRERDTFLKWMQENVVEGGPDQFARYVRVGK